MELNLKLTDRQSAAYNALNEAKHDVVDVLYGGAKGGGKSWLLCNWVYLWSLALIKDFKLKPTKNPRHIGWIGRKIGTDFTATTLQTWQEVIPEQDYEVKGATEKHPKHILIRGTVAVDYGGLDRREDISKFNSAEYVLIAIDQAEETTENDIATLRATRRMRIKGTSLKYKGLFTANPRNCWLKEEFISNPAKNRRFVQALPSDNPHLPDSYIETLKESFSYRPELLQAYLYGSWESLEGVNQMIKYEWLQAARERGKQLVVKRFLVCDPARFGDDKCVIFLMEDADIAEKVILPYCRTTEISNRMARMSKQNDDCVCVVESIGADLGAGVLDELTQLGVETIRFNPSGEPLDKEKYYNSRAEAWNLAAKCLSDGVMPNSNMLLSLTNPDTSLINQLCAPTYQYRGRKLLVEPKADIKKRLGRSPDEGDTYVIALWAWSRVENRGQVREKVNKYKALAEKYRSPFNV